MHRWNPGKYRSLLIIVALAQGVVLTATLAIGFDTTRHYERLLAEYGETRSRATATEAVEALLWQDHIALVQRTGAEIAREVQPLLDDPDALAAHLTESYRRGAVSNGEILLLGVSVHGLDAAARATDWRAGAAPALPPALATALAAREGAERLRPMVHGWLHQGQPVVSVVLPVGGLALRGYTALHVDPTAALSAMDLRLATPLRLLDPAGTELPGPDNLPRPETAEETRLAVTAPDGTPLMQVALLEDHTPLQATMAAARNRALALTLAVAGGLALAVVLTVWRYLAQAQGRETALAEEIAAAQAVEARRAEDAAEAQRQRDSEAARNAAEQDRVVREISAGLTRLASGDLTAPIESPPHDPFPEDYAALMHAYNGVLRQLEEVFGQIRTVAGDVTGGAERIDEAARELSARAETQAATLEQSSAALNQLTASVRSTAERARSGAEESHANREAAQGGAEVVGRAIAAMGAIEESSAQIARIIGAIDDIAFQTNLLALNAGVEAARAGEAGRGFAVVASEVRALAQRAASSAREIKELIARSSDHVVNGSELVREAGASLQAILERARTTSETMAEIAAAAREQAAGIHEINEGVSQLDQVTQENATAAAETTSAAGKLTGKAQDLAAAIRQFRLGRSAPVLPFTPPTTRPKTAVAGG